MQKVIECVPSLVSEGSFLPPLGSGMHRTELSMGPGLPSSSIVASLASLSVREIPLWSGEAEDVECEGVEGVEVRGNCIRTITRTHTYQC